MSASATITAAPPHIPTPNGRSALSEQLDQEDGEKTPRSTKTTNTVYATPKPRSLSDAPKPQLSPSPAFREPLRRTSKDDFALEQPTTPRRVPFPARGLSLTMPNKDGLAESPSSRIPLSPKLETSHIYGSPASMLPRRSRGLDYTRACTNLHHSTLAISSPDASPVTGRGVNIPQRRSLGGSTVLDSPSNTSASLWSTMPERTTLSSSVSSVNMLDSDSDTETSSDDGMVIDRETDDPMIHTPAASRLNSGLAGMMNSPGMEWQNQHHPSPAHASLASFHSNLMSFRRARMKKGKSQHSSSSVSMNSSKPSPGPLSPGITKSIEPNGYFGLTRAQVQSRRESLSLGTNDLHLSDPEDNSNKLNGSQPSSDMDGANSEGARGVVRRAVTRRSNLLPKTRGFARIKAALLEESTPIDSDARREAEVIRQVQENDPVFSPHKSPPVPDLLATGPTPSEESPVPSVESKVHSLPSTFNQHAKENSAGLGFWNTFDERYRTPPPAFLPRESSSAISDDNDTPASGSQAFLHLNRSRSRSNTPLANYNPPTAGDVARRVNNKRRRDDEFDPAFTKRRAVSPGMSVQSSPVLPQSPVMSNDKGWGKPPAAKTNGHGTGERSNSGGSVSNTKKVGMQVMHDANEGIMSMSID